MVRTKDMQKMLVCGEFQELDIADGQKPDGLAGLPYDLQIRPAQDFNHDSAKNKLSELEIASGRPGDAVFMIPGDGMSYEPTENAEDLGFTSHQGKILRLASWIDLSNKVSVGCAGAVLSYLQRCRAAEYLPGDTNADNALRVRSVEMTGLGGSM